MNSIDNKIKYYELIMRYDNTKKYYNYDLPLGFHYEMFNVGDELDWVDIHIKSGEFCSIEQGLEFFHLFYDSFYDELSKRLIFIVDSNTNEKVGTATISKLENSEFGYCAAVDWVAIKKSYQGRKLSKPLISKFISIANKLGYDKLILHTQTTTPVAAKIYLDYGFDILDVGDEYGYRVLKTIFNHDKLKKYKKLDIEEIYDKRNILIEKKLDDIFGKSNYQYSVWYKNGLHDVYVYSDSYHEYLYYLEDNDVRLEEVLENRKYKK